MRFNIEAMQEGDWPEVRRIYAEGLRTGLAAFVTSAPQWESWDRAHLPIGRLVARDSKGRVAGWSALTPVPDTWGAAGVAEVSVYVTASAKRHGIGRALLARLISESEREGYWTLQAQVIAANAASTALLVACGFRQVGNRERYGHLEGIWHDVTLLERRSANSGGPGLPTKTCS